jgi:hypothetical protein
MFVPGGVAALRGLKRLPGFRTADPSTPRRKKRAAPLRMTTFEVARAKNKSRSFDYAAQKARRSAQDDNF